MVEYLPLSFGVRGPLQTRKERLKGKPLGSRGERISPGCRAFRKAPKDVDDQPTSFNKPTFDITFSSSSARLAFDPSRGKQCKEVG